HHRDPHPLPTPRSSDRNPDGPGWIQHRVRQQKHYPEVVTDSYLHSIMMAGIVAAHETTAHASANAIKLMLEKRERWDELCAHPRSEEHTSELQSRFDLV